MGTTLTGTTPQDTYDSLIKVTDNGPLSGTAKYLSDGLGNDSILALSTTALGIGTASPTSLAQLNGTAGTAHLRVSEAGATIGFLGGANGIISGATGSMALRAEAGLVLSSQGNAQTMTLTSAGNVGIGTSSPASYGAGYRTLAINGTTDGGVIDLLINGVRKGSIYNTSSGNTLSVDALSGTSISFVINAAERAAVTQNGITFNGDTAAANALDDYEEGTWTMGLAFGGASVGVTYGANTGAYTKIGRKVTVTGYLSLSSKGSSTGIARITGLPFAIGTGFQFSAAANGFLNNTSYTGIPQSVGLSGSSVVEFYQLSVLGALTDLTNANFANNSEVYLSFTYFV